MRVSASLILVLSINLVSVSGVAGGGAPEATDAFSMPGIQPLETEATSTATACPTWWSAMREAPATS